MPGPARILVVDDEARIAEVVQGYLEGQGHNLRRKLDDDARAPRLVLTVYGRGYAFAEDQR